MIPGVVHQTWKNAEVTHWIFQRSQASVQEHLSDFEYRFWTDKDLESLIEEDYPEYLDRWQNLSAPIKRVDLARCLILHKHGGVYADLDFIFTGRVSEILTDEIDLFFYKSTQAIVNEWDFLGNALMGAAAGHPFWIEFVEHALELPSNTPVLKHTGPRALGRFVEQMPDKPDIKVFGPDFFDNQNCGDGTGEAAYGHHVRTATWQYPDSM